MKNIIYLFVAILTITSCNTTEPKNEVSELDTKLINSTIDTTSTIEVDTTTTSVLADSLVQAGYVDEEEETKNIIEEKFGVQWDFCDCVVKSDSVNKAIENMGDLTDEETDILIARWDEVDSHCKEMISGPNNTPEERKRHERKVRKCLRNAK